MKITTIGIDLAKSVFQVHGVDRRGKLVVLKRLRRNQMLTYFAQLSPCSSAWKLAEELTTGQGSCRHKDMR